MRKNPTYALVAAGLVLCLPTALAGKPPPTATVLVDCTDPDPTKHDSITTALETPAKELTLEITGLCQEMVVITRSNVSLIGSDPLVDGITGPALDDPVVERALVRVLDSRNVRFENLTITGSESRGLEGDDWAVVDVVKCRITGNDMRGLQMGKHSLATVEDTVIADNDNLALSAFHHGQVTCRRCTVESDSAWGNLVVAVSHARISMIDSSISTNGFSAVSAWSSSWISGTDTDVSALSWSLWATGSSQINWTGGDLSGSVVADTASQLFLDGINQTANIDGNFATDDSHLQITGGTFVGDTRLTGFSDGTAENGPSFDSVTCDRGGDLFCDGTETKKSSSGCGLCP